MWVVPVIKIESKGFNFYNKSNSLMWKKKKKMTLLRLVGNGQLSGNGDSCWKPTFTKLNLSHLISKPFTKWHHSWSSALSKGKVETYLFLDSHRFSLSSFSFQCITNLIINSLHFVSSLRNGYWPQILKLLYT